MEIGRTGVLGPLTAPPGLGKMALEMGLDPVPTAWTVDVSRWPVLVTAPTSYMDDPAALAEMYRQYGVLLTRGVPFGCLFDLRGHKSDPIRRRRFTDWYTANALAIRATCVACAAVVGNPVEAGIVTAYSWLFKAPFPLKVTSSPEIAEEWLRRQVERATRDTAAS